MIRYLRFAVVTTPLLLGSVGCVSDAPTPIRALDTRTAPCPDHAIDGDVTCHRVTVPEDPGRPDGRAIDLERLGAPGLEHHDL